MKATSILCLAVFSVALACSTSVRAQQIRQVQPRRGQQAAPQQTSDAPPLLRQVAPRGSEPQAIERGQTAAMSVPRYQPPRRIIQQWRLGIDTTDAPKGVRVTTVYRNSAALTQLGLEPGDYILDVAGYPVGEFQGTYYELADQLNLYADRQGWVNISVWNFRTQRDEPYWVQLSR